MRYALVILAAWCVSGILAAPAPLRLRHGNAFDAERMADRWWGAWYQGEPGQWGAVWHWPGAPSKCYVGICDGKTDRPGPGSIKLLGERGWYELNWNASQRAPCGRWYKDPVWFGRGDTWEDAFRDAIDRGHPPMTGGDIDRAEEFRFFMALPGKRVK